MSRLEPISPLGGLKRQYDGFLFKEVEACELVALSRIEGEDKAFKAAFKKRFGKTPPAPLELKSVKGGHVFWSGQGQYMVLLSGENVDADRGLAQAFEGTGYTTLQTDGWAHLAVSGARIADVFERFIPLDMRAFKVGQATRTHAHHMAVMVLRMGGDDYRLLTPSSSCTGFVQGLEAICSRLRYSHIR